MGSGRFGKLSRDLVATIFTSSETDSTLAAKYRDLGVIKDHVRAIRTRKWYARYTEGLRPGWKQLHWLSPEERAAIRAEPGSIPKVARKFGVANSTVHRIRHGQVSTRTERGPPLTQGWRSLLNPSVRTPIDWFAIIDAIEHPPRQRRKRRPPLATKRVRPGYLHPDSKHVIVQRVYRIGEGPFSKRNGSNLHLRPKGK